jgi:hypothetical protein
MSLSYSAIQGLKTRLTDLLCAFEAENPGATVSATFEVRPAAGGEKIKVALAGPYNQPTLPGMEDGTRGHLPNADDIRRWRRQEHGEDTPNG